MASDVALEQPLLAHRREHGRREAHRLAHHDRARAPELVEQLAKRERAVLVEEAVDAGVDHAAVVLGGAKLAPVLVRDDEQLLDVAARERVERVRDAALLELLEEPEHELAHVRFVEVLEEEALAAAEEVLEVLPHV